MTATNTPRRRGLERFLYRFDKDPALQAAFTSNPAHALANFALEPEERDALAARDVARLYRWGLHPLLIRNFAGTLRVDYLAAYRQAGLE